MVSKSTLDTGRKYLQDGHFDLLFYGLIFFIASRWCLLLDKFHYNLSRVCHRKPYGLNEIVEVNGHLMQISLEDKGISQELYLHKKREHFSTDFINSFVQENEIVIDIGANIGYYALLESKLAKDGEVYAIEPIPSNFSLLERNIELNGYKNISTYQLAISDSDMIKTMYIYDKCNWCSFNKNLDGSQTGQLDVMSMTLDKFTETYLNKKPTFVRMDLEGHEYQAIKGASKILRECAPLKLNIEFHPHLMPKEHMKELLSILKENNFAIRAVTFNPPAHIYRNFKLFNYLRRKLGYYEFGLNNASYEDLEKIVNSKFSTPIVFFEKEFCTRL
ncbi:MAG: FkbM family methyltransferase [Candidatus Cloacimonadia bacterium]